MLSKETSEDTRNRTTIPLSSSPYSGHYCNWAISTQHVDAAGRPGCFQRKLLKIPGIEPRSLCRPANILVTIVTELSRLNTLIRHFWLTILSGQYSNCDKFLKLISGFHCNGKVWKYFSVFLPSAYFLSFSFRAFLIVSADIEWLVRRFILQSLKQKAVYEWLAHLGPSVLLHLLQAKWFY